MRLLEIETNALQCTFSHLRKRIKKASKTVHGKDQNPKHVNWFPTKEQEKIKSCTNRDYCYYN